MIAIGARGTNDEFTAMLAAWVAEVRPETIATREPPWPGPGPIGRAGRGDEVAALLRARLDGEPDATALIHQTSRGYPRAVNNLALQALVAAFAADKTIVDESATRTAVAEVTAE
jgi:hypothetical protein